jgi:hypothetical protein
VECEECRDALVRTLRRADMHGEAIELRSESGFITSETFTLGSQSPVS